MAAIDDEHEIGEDLEDIEDDEEEEEEEPHREIPKVTSAEIDARAKSAKSMKAMRMDFKIAVVDDSLWPMITLHPTDSWVLHHLSLDRINKRPGIRAVITKTERCGPKSLPYTEYVIHVKTAFSVRAISRRFKDFKALDEAIRSEFGVVAVFPKPKIFGHMKAKFVESRRKLLQTYLNECLSQRKVASSFAMKNFLQIQGHGVEESIVDGNIREPEPQFKFWSGDVHARLENAEREVEDSVLTGDGVGEAMGGNRAALCLTQTKNFDKAVVLLEKSIEKCIENDNPFGAIVCTSNLGCVLLSQGSVEAATDRMARTLDAIRKLQPADRAELPVPEKIFVSNLTTAIGCGGNMSRAAESVAEIIQLCEETHDGPGLGAALYLKGCVEYLRGEVRSAVEALESSLVLRRKHKEKLLLGETLAKLGVCFSDIGYNLHAMDYFEQAIALAQEVGDRRGEATCLMWLGRVHHLHGDARAAMKYFSECLEISKKIKSVATLARASYFLSLVCADNGDRAGALRHAQHCISFVAKLSPKPTWAEAAIKDCQERESSQLTSAGGEAASERDPIPMAPPGGGATSENKKKPSGKQETSFTLAFKFHLPGKALSSHLKTLRGAVSHRYKFE